MAAHAIRWRALGILKDVGARYWTQAPVRRKGAAVTVARAIGVDLSKPDQWVALRSILGESARQKQIDALRKWAASAGKPVEGPGFDKLLVEFDERANRGPETASNCKSTARWLLSPESRTTMSP